MSYTGHCIWKGIQVSLDQQPADFLRCHCTTPPLNPITSTDVLIKVAAAGFCHTDYQVYEGVYNSREIRLIVRNGSEGSPALPI
ncbi:uncharacterized protein BO80DRAFT_463333 [Aspergillus ibericus CBS 121593]|uniref:Alcohol dehydrogenase-like N-terminal domain-containing protein n=1 Tax=Aspergillus ibericus CBS 121593 TaxID=1448316 RepID=A0A395H4L5_9EURO|nr:hypothetical protein BO80DRAFT_463333 [Aspergillus ibericus CBS 121593]RAL02573.1 hypothetical protein BO80DRAFT_463333 [Aspergillus ibericus CBS 121593]